MKNRILFLVAAIPATAVLMGIITLYVAFANPDPGVRADQPVMSKTSWQVPEATP